jgi:hypothetical protein
MNLFDVEALTCNGFRFMVVLICLIFSVLSTIEEYASFANETLFYMVSTCPQSTEGSFLQES